MAQHGHCVIQNFRTPSRAADQGGRDTETQMRARGVQYEPPPNNKNREERQSFFFELWKNKKKHGSAKHFTLRSAHKFYFEAPEYIKFGGQMQFFFENPI